MSDITIRKAAVIGAGTMGSGIAAHLANAGLDVVLLDIKLEFAQGGIDRQLKAGGFMRPEFAARVKPGATGTDMGLLADCDWIIEAVAERIEIKHALFTSIAAVRKPDAIAASNTSTIPLHILLDGFSEDFASHFLITHFFNPPRHMRLLELVTGPRTASTVADTITRFADERLGKGVVPCKDTPGFIGNRIGCYWLAVGLDEAIRSGIPVEVADATIGRAFGFPKTGILGLYDLIGNDLMPQLIRSLQDALPKTDAVQAIAAEPPLLHDMLAKGLTGRKGGGGFYRRSADRKSIEVIDLTTGAYRPQQPATSDSLDAANGDARALIGHPGQAGRYARAVLSATLAYSASLVPEIADRPDLVDEAMRLGYGWKFGPFELIDRIGAQWLADALAADGVAVPPLLADATRSGGFYRIVDGVRHVLAPRADKSDYVPVPIADGVISLAAIKLRDRPVSTDEAASLWDIGDGVGLLEFHTKMNSFSPALLNAVTRTVKLAPQHFKALVIGNEGPAFSAGADLSAVLAMSANGDAAGIRAFALAGVAAFDAVHDAPYPIVGAGFGAALGGGCEVLLHCHAVVADAEIGIGLVEPRVGLLPGWGGLTELMVRLQERFDDPAEAAATALRTVLAATTSAGAHDARAKAFLRPTDGIVMNHDRLIAQAKAHALALLPGFTTPVRAPVTLPEASVLDAVLADMAPSLAPHDIVIGRAIADVLSGPITLTHAELNARAVMAFEALALSEPTRARITQMLRTGKPLRN
ncbi:3-hydroxyacyl-CoA dehydrogenase/enoyl-CoA hydratase family protein [Sphingomonas sp. NFR15]|uniref:3-hydroxyacyl-CoA dehydrogenase/enoyl-CoA hydratase family protein n=1 Tax=Sphingomonas sp. NFR15 TaxID=1566282 RepID=UPI0008829F42|nr:3-hydroxyacyl-CoA dehydrogenase/enoyl-CoA hydratase family protein [Sphingomonas sp. NFR15]SDA20001.1 3-hydroxyacyl-CoA dehydrogenase [Sphingomonas sp. NFR15]